VEERRSPKGPVPLLSRARIADAAVALADEQGLEAVTMRRLGAELGGAGASLYRYVSSREELVDLMVDRVSRDLEHEATTGDWRHDVVALATALLGVHRRHRWLVDVRQGRASLGPSAVDLFERGLAALVPLPIDDRRKMEAIAMLIGVVTLFAQQEAHVSAVAFPAPDGERWPLLAIALRGAPPDPAPAADLFDRAVLGAVSGVLGQGAEV
jgi:AcrR family transcriptional regulator